MNILIVEDAELAGAHLKTMMSAIPGISAICHSPIEQCGFARLYGNWNTPASNTTDSTDSLSRSKRRKPSCLELAKGK